MPSLLLRWERENTSRWRRCLTEFWGLVGRPATGLALVAAGFLLGAFLATRTIAPPVVPELRDRLSETDAALQDARGELELVQLERDRLSKIVDYSQRYEIPADLAASIYDVALAEGVEPGLAFGLVRVESQFVQKAVSHMGAVGLTQVMPRTAFSLDPELGYSDLFRRDTNLHLGFSYLRLMLQRYRGDLRLALLAYNRGPATVDAIRRRGGDPANGYARAVLGGQ